jgi:hypothetical protein
VPLSLTGRQTPQVISGFLGISARAVLFFRFLIIVITFIILRLFIILRRIVLVFVIDRLASFLFLRPRV